MSATRKHSLNRSTRRLQKMPIIIKSYPESSDDMWTRSDLQVNPYLASVYKTGQIENKSGQLIKFKDITNPEEGRHLYNLVYENKWNRTLEVGFAMGASAAWICQAHKQLAHEHLTTKNKHKHYAIDPNQYTDYGGMGDELLRRCGVKSYLNLIQQPSHVALPKLVEKVKNGTIPKFQLIYIDGWHTFDYTLLDFFYSNLLLEIGGVIVLDDIKHKPVRKFHEYVKTNFPNCKVIQTTPCYVEGNMAKSSQATYVKMGEDTRTWNAYANF